MYARGWLICDCDAAYSFEECDLIAWNPDKHEVCSADTPNSFIFGAVSVRCEKGGKLVGVDVPA